MPHYTFCTRASNSNVCGYCREGSRYYCYDSNSLTVSGCPSPLIMLVRQIHVKKLGRHFLVPELVRFCLESPNLSDVGICYDKDVVASTQSPEDMLSVIHSHNSTWLSTQLSSLFYEYNTCMVCWSWKYHLLDSRSRRRAEVLLSLPITTQWNSASRCCTSSTVDSPAWHSSRRGDGERVGSHRDCCCIGTCNCMAWRCLLATTAAVASVVAA